MLLGIDVGGTFTDAVLIGRGTIIAQAKRRTTHEAVLMKIKRQLILNLQKHQGLLSKAKNKMAAVS